MCLLAARTATVTALGTEISLSTDPPHGGATDRLAPPHVRLAVKRLRHWGCLERGDNGVPDAPVPAMLAFDDLIANLSEI